MKRLFIIVYLFFSVTVSAQQNPDENTEAAETTLTANEESVENDQWLQELDYYKKHPLSLNTASAEELAELHILNPVQAEQLIAYRKQFGAFIHLYELQAVPGIDLQTIRRLLPYISVSVPETPGSLLGQFRRGDHLLLIRTTYKSGEKDTSYTGSPFSLLLRYKYRFKNKMQYGFTGEKDAGESFFRGAQPKGFDFYSAHFFLRLKGLVRTIALGDFTVNMGQGLIQWQSLSFRKSADVLVVKRQSAVIRPYSSSGETGFYRGAAFSLQQKHVQFTGFASAQQMDAHLQTDSSGFSEITSFSTTGYHRNAAENGIRHNTRRQTAGAVISYSRHHWQWNLNGVGYRYNHAIHKREEPYNLYAFRGSDGYNISTDYSITFRNLHLFGEAASDQGLHKAFVQGILLSADPRADLSVLFRRIDKDFQTAGGSAFTESTLPVNESGLYLGMSFRPVTAIRLDFYADFFRFPWLRYQINSPAAGSEYLFQCTYTPSRQFSFYSRYRYEKKQEGVAASARAIHYTGNTVQQNWRNALEYKLNTDWTIRTRIEMVRVSDYTGTENGVLCLLDGVWKPLLKKWGLTGRVQFYDTDSYKSRVYAFENDLTYSFSIPAFFGTGFRAWLVGQYDLLKGLAANLRWAGNFLPGTNSHYSHNELKFQLIYMF